MFTEVKYKEINRSPLNTRTRKDNDPLRHLDRPKRKVYIYVYIFLILTSESVIIGVLSILSLTASQQVGLGGEVGLELGLTWKPFDSLAGR